MLLQVKKGFRGLWRLLNPHMPKEQREELGRSSAFAKARAAIAEGARRQQAGMHEEMRAVARANSAIEHKAVNGLGEKVATIPQSVFNQMRAIYGDACWEDPEFMRAFLRDNPACRVKTTRGTRGQEYAGRRSLNFRPHANGAGNGGPSKEGPAKA